MKLTSVLASLGLILATPSAAQDGRERPSQQQPAPVDVMIVATYHMDNPGLDLINMRSDDVLTSARQREIRQVNTSLARFRPTLVAVESRAAPAQAGWREFQAGRLASSRNEVVLLGFRLADQAGARVVGVDAEGEFPFQPLATFAHANGFGALLQAGLAEAQALVAEKQQILERRGIPGLLHRINDPARIRHGHGLYMNTLRIGRGDQQPGVDLISAWYERNARICANLIQATRPGDRVIMFFGENHSHFLRQCILDTPGLRLVEARAYLPPSAAARSRSAAPR